MIITKSDHAPSPVERLDEYLANLSNAIERVWRDGGDPRQIMTDVAKRQQRGNELQIAMVRGGR